MARVIGFAFALVLAAPAIVSSQTPAGPLAAYALSNGTDASGHGRTATLVNTSLVTGKYNGGQRFDGNTSRVSAPAPPLSSAFTLEAWANLDGLTGRRVAVGRGVTSWQAVIYESLDRVFLAEVGGFLTAGFTPATGALVQVIAPVPLTAGAWHHVAAVYDGAHLTLYMDGTQTATIAATGAVIASAAPLELGGSATDAGYLKGILDDVRIYDRALSSAEITRDLSSAVDLMAETVTAWNLEVWRAGDVPGAGGPPISAHIFPIGEASCNLTPTPPPTGTIENPTHARVSDPNAAGRECELLAEAFFAGLPYALGYFSTAEARGATTQSGRSAPSNPFDRVAEATPPATPGRPAVVAK